MTVTEKNMSDYIKLHELDNVGVLITRGRASPLGTRSPCGTSPRAKR